MAVKDMAAALQDVRKMRRSLRLRQESDPDVVAETLDTILKESIAVRASAGGRLGKGAVNELKNIRRSLIAGQIDSGEKTSQFVGQYSMIIDQIADTEKKTRKEAKQSSQGPGVAGAISQNLPSADAITSALITANPLMGYSMKIAKDVFSAGKTRRKAAREIEQKELENLRKEEQNLQENESQAPEGSQEQSDIGAKLDLIREEIKQLVTIWSDSDSNLERIVEETSETNKLEKEKESRSDLLKAETNYETSNFGAGNASDSIEGALDDGMDENSGLFAGLGGAVGGIAGQLASKMLAPFMGLMRFIKNGGTILGRLGRVSGLLTAAWAIYDFVDGFANAGDILDKEQSEISITDRIRVGSASIISGLLTPVDWVLDFVGMGFMEDKDSFTGKIANSESQLLQFLLSPGSWIIDYLREYDYEAAKEDILRMVTDPLGYFSDLWANITSPIMEWMEETFNVTAQVEKIKNMIEGPFDKMIELFEGIRNGINNWFDSKVQSIKDSWVGQTFGNTVDFFKGDDEKTTEESGSTEDVPSRPNIEDFALTSIAVDSALEVANKLDQSQQGGGGGGTSNVNVNNSNSNVINHAAPGPSGSQNQDRSHRRVLDSMTLNSL